MNLQILQLIIVSPERILFEGDVEHITFPGTLGSFAVFPEHAPLISSLEQGVINYSVDGNKKTLNIKSGFVEIKDDIISVCVEQ